MKKKEKILILPVTASLKHVMYKYKDQYEFDYGTYDQIELLFLKNNTKILFKGKDIREYDKIWLTSTWNTRDIAYAVNLYLEKEKIVHTITEVSSSKITDQMKFALAGLRTPNSWFSTKVSLKRYINNIEKTCKYPMVIKDSLGSRGLFSSYITDATDLFATRISLPREKQYIIQEFVHNDYEWGILVANGAIVSAEKSYPANGEFRNNACNGAKEVFVDIKDIPNSICEIVYKAVSVLNLDWCRVDIFEDNNTGEVYLLEVNRFPGITTGSDEELGASTFMDSLLAK